MLQSIFAGLYDVFGTNFLWLVARAVEGILEAQAAGPGVGVFWGTAGLDRGGHFCSVAFKILAFLAFSMKRGFYSSEIICILRCV